MKKIRNLIFTCLAVTALILTGCGPKAPVVPTQSPEEIYTSVASTMQAQFTATALAMPTYTFTPEPTQTYTPTTPPLPTIQNTEPIEPIITAAAPQQPAGLPTSTPISTNVPGDHAILGYQIPADHSTYNVMEQVNLTWGFLNTGTTTWNVDYYIQYTGGTRMWGENSMRVRKDIKPGNKIEFTLPLRMPEEPGEYTMWWGFFNDKKKEFFKMYFVVNVVR